MKLRKRERESIMSLREREYYETEREREREREGGVYETECNPLTVLSRMQSLLFVWCQQCLCQL